MTGPILEAVIPRRSYTHTQDYLLSLLPLESNFARSRCLFSFTCRTCRLVICKYLRISVMKNWGWRGCRRCDVPLPARRLACSAPPTMDVHAYDSGQHCDFCGSPHILDGWMDHSFPPARVRPSNLLRPQPSNVNRTFWEYRW